MFRNKPAALLLFLVLPFVISTGARASSLIPDTEIREETARYNTTTVEVMDAVSEMTCSADFYLPAMHSVYYNGPEAYFVSSSGVINNDYTVNENVIEIRTNVDEIRLEELKLKKAEAEKAYGDDVAVRQKELQKLNEQYVSAASVGDVYTATEMNLSIQALNTETEKAQYEYEQRIADLEDDIEELEEALMMKYISAPFSGRIAWIQTYSKDEIIHPGDLVMTLMDLSKVYLRASNAIPPGTPVKIEVLYRGDTYYFEGRSVVNCSALTSGQKSGSIIEFDPSQFDTLDVDLGSINLRMIRMNVIYSSGSQKNILCVSTDALIKDDLNYYAEILDDDNIIHRRPVKVLLLKNRMAWVIEGLSEGDTVILQ